jgi:hypothetical protein
VKSSEAPHLLPIDRLRMDGGTQPRATLDEATIAAYVRDMENGDEFPPVEVYYDGTNYWLVDGFHRLAATKRLKRLQITATVRQGSLDDAQWFSYGVNQRHGLRRTNDDKRRAVEAALKHEYAARYSDNEIARHCGVSAPTIAKYRRNTYGGDYKNFIVTRTGGDGRTINTANIGKRTGPSPASSGNNGAGSEPTPEQVSTSPSSGMGERVLGVALANPPDQSRREGTGATVPVSAPDHAGSGRSRTPALASPPNQVAGEGTRATVPVSAPDHAGNGRSDIPALASPPNQVAGEGTGTTVPVSAPDHAGNRRSGAPALANLPDQSRQEGMGAPALANHPEQPGERVVIGAPALASLPDQTDERTVAFPCTINGVTIHQGDCCAVLARMDPESVDLIITSPPYNVGVGYDGYNDSLPPDEYEALMHEWLQAALRVLKRDGRMCLNVPLDTHNDPTLGFRFFAHCQSAGFKLKTTIIWNEQNINKGTAWGSWRSASAPHVTLRRG